MAASTDKNSKRRRLGNRVQRGIYKAAHGYKHPWYGELCAKATRLNHKTGEARQESKHNAAESARQQACEVERGVINLRLWGLHA